jgi:hypothetical protein
MTPPPSQMDQPDKNPPVSLESLLRIKRCEVPDDGFWDSFEKDFNRRRLHSLVKQDQSWRLWNPLVKWMTVAVPALGLLALGVLGWRGQETSSPILAEVATDQVRLGMEEAPAAVSDAAMSVDIIGSGPSAQGLSSQFVMDAIEQRATTTHSFRKVLYTPALEVPVPSGASYVRDTLRSRSYSVTTADYSLGRNF